MSNDSEIIPVVSNRAGLFMPAPDLKINLFDSSKPESSPSWFLSMQNFLNHIKPVDWLIDGALERDTLSSLFAASGSGKSFIALDIAAHIATGKDWHGRSVKKGTVVYFCGEGSRGLKRRARAWYDHHKLSLDDLLLCEKRIDGQSTQEMTSLLNNMAIHVDQKPVLMVVDTVSCYFGAGDQNSAKDTTVFLNHMERLRSLMNCTILLVHHTGHESKDRARGSSAFRAAMDAEYTCQKFDRLIELRSTKQKDADLPEPVRFELLSVELGEGLGESAVLQKTDKPLPVDEDEIVSSQQTLSAKYLTALHILEGMSDEYRDRKKRSGIDDGMILVEAKDWRKRCLDADVTQSKHWSRIPELLEKKGLIRRQGIHVFPTVPTSGDF